MTEVLAAAVGFLRERGVRLLRYKAVPHVYHAGPAEEDLFALVASGARLAHRSALSVLAPAASPPPQERRRRALRKARQAGLEVVESADLEDYWALLERVLGERYGARPVHTLAEIQGLQERFPRRIRLLAVRRAGEMLAGILIYESERVLRAQYIAASAGGRAAGALDLILDRLVTEARAAARVLDLGTSEGEGRSGLNEGVIQFKESLGARTVAQDTYELPIAGGPSSAVPPREVR
jgi:hypothetical protein